MYFENESDCASYMILFLLINIITCGLKEAENFADRPTTRTILCKIVLVKSREQNGVIFSTN
ncbi:uncharacterized protein PRCAT00005623001 [Priceomyces carsonii]|uniref:uncharacterized protein n=1 Tax=Priceomyces carsonii TaxID=28549 RepID=UPI002ED86A16|nr:unnamed protein product [Priceomyces carsonii]